MKKPKYRIPNLQITWPKDRPTKARFEELLRQYRLATGETVPYYKLGLFLIEVCLDQFSKDEIVQAMRTEFMQKPKEVKNE